MAPYGEVERELAVLLRRARAWNREVATVVHPDLQPTAYALLARVDELGSARAIDLSDYFGIDKGAISRQVGLLERVGLVSREPDPDDGRAQLLVVTTEGTQAAGAGPRRAPPAGPRAAGPVAGAGRRDLRRAARPVQPADGRGRRRRDDH